MKFQWKALALNLAIPLGVGFLSFLLTPAIRDRYAQLYRPPFAPPGWVFPVVWTVLFILMGLASFLITVSGDPRRTEALKYYGLQLFFNLLWPVLFFRLGLFLPAFFWLLILWFLVFIVVKKYWEIDELAGKLTFPYLLWLTFAAYLNLSIALKAL